MKFEIIIIILAILFGLWTIYFIYELNKPIISDNYVFPLKEQNKIKIIPFNEEGIPKDAKL